VHNVEAEDYILGGILAFPESLSKVLGILLPEHFYSTSNARIYRSILSLHKQGKLPGFVLVALELEKIGLLEQVGGKGRIANLCEIGILYHHNLELYAELVIEKYRRRSLADMAYSIQQDCANPS